MKNPKVIRPGDSVKIIDPRFVTRVGYPLCADDLMEESEKVLVDLKLIPPRRTNYRDNKLADRRRDEQAVVRKYAILLLRNKGWGGNARALHFIEKPEYKDFEIKVQAKRIVQTGERVGPRASQRNGWDGVDYDYDPGGLRDRKTHMLLALHRDSYFAIGEDYDDYGNRPDPNWGRFPDRNWSKEHYALVIPAAHVVKVTHEI